jgi:hypothetical protein
VYAGFGFIFFAMNDPFHFGTYPMALIAWFQLSTFDNFFQLYHINFGGCDHFPSEYIDSLSGLTTAELMVPTVWGEFILPACRQPQARPVISTIVFVSFFIIEGYVIVSMLLAAVAIDINEKLESLRGTELFGKDDDDDDEFSMSYHEKQDSKQQQAEGSVVGQAYHSTHGSMEGSVHRAAAAPVLSSETPVPKTTTNADGVVTFDFADDGSYYSHKKLADGTAPPSTNNENAIHPGPIANSESVAKSTHLELVPPAGGQRSAENSIVRTENNARNENNRAAANRSSASVASTDGGKGNSTPVKPKAQPKKNNAAANKAKAAKLLGNSEESKEIKVLLREIWRQTGQTRSNNSFTTGGPAYGGVFRDARSLAIVLNLRLSSSTYKIAYALCIIGDVICMLYSIGNSDPLSIDAMIGMAWFFQCLFLLDTFARLFCRWGATTDDCLKDMWFWFSVLISTCNITALSVPSSNYDWVAILLMTRLLRILRVFKTISLFFVDMKIILTSFSSAFISLLYVMLLIFFYFTYFAIAAVLLFKRAVPFHFGDIISSYRTLFSVMMYDNWGDIIKQCIYGCRYYGYNSGVAYFDNSCRYDTKPVGDGMGYFAPIFFIVFAILSGMILTSLLVGVIIKSLELLKEENNEEKEVRDKLNRVKRKYHLDNETVVVYLKLFEKIDKNSNGRLVFPEMVILLDVLEMDAAEQFEFFLKVDSDRSGQIDFSEFTEMMALISLAKRTHKGLDAKAKAGGKKAKAASDNENNNDKGAGDNKNGLTGAPVSSILNTKKAQDKAENARLELEMLSQKLSPRKISHAEAEIGNVANSFNGHANAASSTMSNYRPIPESDENNVNLYSGGDNSAGNSGSPELHRADTKEDGTGDIFEVSPAFAVAADIQRQLSASFHHHSKRHSGQSDDQHANHSTRSANGHTYNKRGASGSWLVSPSQSTSININRVVPVSGDTADSARGPPKSRAAFADFSGK